MRAFGFYGWVMNLLFILVGFSYASSYLVGGEYRAMPGGGKSLIIKYDRINEVRKECSSVLSSASDIKPGDDMVFNLKEELSFLNGDWWQELNKAPLMPFDNSNFANPWVPESLLEPVSNNSLYIIGSPSNIVSFWVTDVSRAHRSQNWIAVNGAMLLGTTIQGLFMERPFEGSNFDIWPGHSQLSIQFQGIYAESDKNGGERIMCLLGKTMLPSRQADSADPWEWVKKPGYNNQPPLASDDQILLLLRYPRTFSLLNRRIQGTIKNLNRESNPKYFDEVSISSGLAASAKYEFGSGEMVSRACEPYPFEDSLMNGDFDVYKGLDVCLILEKFTHQDAFKFVPNWKCNGSDEYCSKLGPFKSEKEGMADFNLVIQDFRCAEEELQEEDGIRRISSVFRAFPSSEEMFFASQRSDLSNLTLSAEGMWKSSSGQLCMVGCLGVLAGERSCHHRICLYIPLTFSLKQRSTITGTFSSFEGNTSTYFPLSFQKLARSGDGDVWDQYTAARPYYKYSKMDAARAILDKEESSNFENKIKKSFLEFPKLEKTESFLFSLSVLSEDLTLHIPAVSDSSSPKSFLSRFEFLIEIMSLGPLFGRYWSAANASAFDDKGEEFSEKQQLLLNVSAQIGVMGKPSYNISVVFVEGLYNPQVGKMYLIGCRDIRTSWKILHESKDLEAGLDCRVEVIVSYPPTTSRWLVNPTARVTISSQRSQDDPLYFEPVKFQTLPVVYRRQREDILSRRGVEGLLRILTLSLAIACLLSQIFYIRANLESVPYTSLVMLGIQGIGYSIPLITGAEAIFEKMASSESYSSSRSSYEIEKGQAITIVNYMVKLLVLVSFSLTMRLCQKVWRSRIRLLTRTPLEPHRVPSDKRVLAATLAIHFVGYILVLLVHFLSSGNRQLQNDNKFIDSSGHSRTLREWETELGEYLGLIQDFFLLPQILGNHIWQLNGKPLRKFYYMGTTAVRLLPHVYDLFRSPILNPYFSQENEFVNPQFEFFSKFGDIAIPAIAVVLAVVVYVQQRWNYAKLSQTITRGTKVYERLGSKVYQRLPSMSFEAELSSGVNEAIGNEGE